MRYVCDGGLSFGRILLFFQFLWRIWTTDATRGFTGRDCGTVQVDRGSRIVAQLPRELEHAAPERILHR
jgi:hypothetical protein